MAITPHFRRPLILELRRIQRTLLFSCLIPNMVYSFPLGPFLGRLSFELRCQILEEAFGNLPLHIFLSPGHMADNESTIPGQPRPSTLEPSGKQWQHSVCIRGGSSIWKLWRDHCLARWKPGPIHNGPLGAMGWILVCRQACVPARFLNVCD